MVEFQDLLWPAVVCRRRAHVQACTLVDLTLPVSESMARVVGIFPAMQQTAPSGYPQEGRARPPGQAAVTTHTKQSDYLLASLEGATSG
jgi:hypothetical protein